MLHHLRKTHFVIKMYIPVLSHLNWSHINQTQSVKDVLQKSCSAKCWSNLQNHVEKILVEKSDKVLVDKYCETYTVDHIQLTASRLSKLVKDVLQKSCSAKSWSNLQNHVENILVEKSDKILVDKTVKHILLTIYN